MLFYSFYKFFKIFFIKYKIKRIEVLQRIIALHYCIFLICKKTEKVKTQRFSRQEKKG